jgi:membrane protease YdiL (CAAX protease family)
MASQHAHRSLDGITALFFLGTSGSLVALASRVPYHEGNYALFYLGFGVWLEATYLAIHFGLATLLVSRERIAERVSQILGILVMIPVGLIIFILGILLAQSIRGSWGYEQEEQISNWVIASLVLLLLVGPEVLIFRYIVFSFERRNGE